MNRLIIVSNRLPVKISRRKGKINVEPSVGGLATGMRSFYKTHDSLWFGWPGINRCKSSSDKESNIDKRLLQEKCKPVYLSQHDINNYYYGFSNKTLWPLFHYFNQYTVYRDDFWYSYKKVNKIFAEEITKEIKKDDIIWIHDYHLFLLPSLIREKFPDIPIGFFLHIPFPSYEVFRLLPWRSELLKGVLGSDLVGFHTYDYQRHFLSSVRRLLGYDTYFHQITLEDRTVSTDTFPMGIDYDKFHNKARELAKTFNKRRSRFKQIFDETTFKTPQTKIILSMDRLDYSKGIPARLEAFELFLEENKQFHGKVSMILLAVPSRTNVEQYRDLKRTVDEMAGRINGKFATIDWTPIRYFYRSLPFYQIIELYLLSDIALVTPLRDGMNLIAKEYLASKINSEGVLILSEMAGSSRELGEAIIVNPNDIGDIVSSINTALNMPKKEQVERNKRMQQRLKRFNVVKWAETFMEKLMEAQKLQAQLKSKLLTDEIANNITENYYNSNNRIIIMDYDGTLIDFQSKAKDMSPDRELRSIIKKLTEDKKNHIVILSDRDKETLNEWFGEYNVSCIAENAVWIKTIKNEWELIEPLDNGWKDELRSVLEHFHDRTPGSAIEEKKYSLAWHYRKADPEFGDIRARELIDELISLTRNLDIDIIEGNKVVEIKSIGINKGRAARKILPERKWDFIMAIGDDWTDEYLYSALPESAYSINVSFRNTHARYCVENIAYVRKMIKKLIR